MPQQPQDKRLNGGTVQREYFMKMDILTSDIDLVSGNGSQVNAYQLDNLS
jgi:hypothetical protein